MYIYHVSVQSDLVEVWRPYYSVLCSICVVKVLEKMNVGCSKLFSGLSESSRVLRLSLDGVYRSGRLGDAADALRCVAARLLCHSLRLSSPLSIHRQDARCAPA